MERARRKVLLGILVVLGLCAFAAVAAQDEKKEDKKAREYTALIVPPAGSSKITPSEIRVKIDRLTTPEEKAALRSLLEKEGQSAALTHAQKNPIGRLVRPASRGVDILYAAEENSDQGSRIVIVTRRFPVYPGTIMNADTMKFPFTIAWFVPTPDGKGEGKIFGATSITLDAKGDVDLKSYQASTADLAKVKSL